MILTGGGVRVLPGMGLAARGGLRPPFPPLGEACGLPRFPRGSLLLSRGGGYWGLEAFYAETCTKHGACPTDEIKMVQSQLCPGVVGVMCLSLFATLFDKEKPKQA